MYFSPVLALNSAIFSIKKHYHGIKSPFETSAAGGADTTYSYPKVTPITAISRQKKSSNFLSPYLSRKRKVKVSTMVIKHPAHNGILKKSSTLLNPHNIFLRTHTLLDNI